MKIVVKTTKTISFDENFDEDGSSSDNKSQESCSKNRDGNQSDKDGSQSDQDYRNMKQQN